MSTTSLFRKRLKSTLLISTIGGLFGLLIPFFIVDDYNLKDIIESMTMGVLIGFFIGFYENFFRYRLMFKSPLLLYLFYKTLLYSLVIVLSLSLVMALSSVLFERVNILSLFSVPNEFNHFLFQGSFLKAFLYSFLLSFLASLVIQINRMFGKNVLLNFLIGKYFKPVKKNIIIMFLDLKSSTAITEKLGDMEYSKFLRDFINDLTEPVIESKARIFQYVGDEVVINWELKDGMKDYNYINCFFLIKKKILSKRNEYIRKYGVIPEFKAGIHFGEIVVSEIGEFKKDIALHGNTINTVSRIQLKAKEMNEDLLISAEALNRLGLPPQYICNPIGNYKLKGKRKSIELCVIKEKNI